jgi:hypothetical protein
MDEQSSVVPEDDPPLVLRKVPQQRHRLARSMIAQGTATAGGIWWELVDAAAAPELPAVAVALTHNDVRGCVTVSALGARHADAGQEYAELLRGLVAALRRHAADAMIIHTAEPVVARALLEVGFLHTPDRNDGNRYLIML